jgi:hypothetical protein
MKKGHPRGPSFEKPDAKLGKTIKHAVRQHRCRLRHNPERMAERVDGIIHAERIHPEMMQATDVNR